MRIANKWQNQTIDPATFTYDSVDHRIGTSKFSKSHPVWTGDAVVSCIVAKSQSPFD